MTLRHAPLSSAGSSLIFALLGVGLAACGSEFSRGDANGGDVGGSGDGDAGDATTGSPDPVTGLPGRPDGGGDDASDGAASVADADATAPVEDAATDAPTCTNACTLNTTQCVTGAVQTCKTQPSGCTQWVTTATCGAHQTCVTVSAGSAAACQCNPAICTQAGKQCDGQATLDTCASDGQCVYVASSVACASPTTCSGQAPNAACAPTCSDSCTKGQTACGSTGVQTCTLGSNGCYSYTQTTACVGAQTCSVNAGRANCNCNNDAACLSTQGNTCTATSNSTSYVTCQKDVGGCFKQAGSATPCAAPQVCTGTAGSASCTCLPDPFCSAAGTYCSSNTVVTCTQDAQKCWHHATTATCTNGTCAGSAGSATCCTNQCTGGAVQCGSSTSIQTCQSTPNACSAWVSQACVSGNVCERRGGVSCVDPSWAEWPMPNNPPDVPSAPNPASFTDGGDGTVTDNVTSLVWQKTISGTYTQAAGIAYCTNLRLAGHADWRMPTYIELISILDYSKLNPAANAIYFPDSLGFWSSSLSAASSADGFVVNFATGQASVGSTTAPSSVRCVR